MAKKTQARSANNTGAAAKPSKNAEKSASAKSKAVPSREKLRTSAKSPSVTVKPEASSTASAEISPGFPIVGIGASAGGLETLETLFNAMPVDTGIGFVVVVHLDRTHISILPELLQKHTKMPVRQIEDGMRVKPNHVYVIPPNKDLTILHGKLYLMDLVAHRGANLPIDSFFRSLAQDQGRNGVCIILSGTGSDGTLGVRAIKGALGMVMVQDEKSAKYDGMPRSAIATGLADYVLPPGKMPAQLVKFVRHATLQEGSKLSRDAELFPEALQKIFVILRARTDHDFSLYKKNTICRRIERRMNVHQIDDISDYLRCLQESDREPFILFKELLIGVTNFFRDPDAYQTLRETILPKLLAGKPEDYAVRVWVTGCSTGEEAYSVAMLLHECIEKSGRHFHIQIFGTDIDEDAIAVARAGLYPQSISADVGSERLKRYFIKEDDGRYRVKKLIREMLVFAPQDVIKDPPFTKLDLLCCRNLLIYLGPELQYKLLPLFHYSLKPDGILFLGSSETIGPATNLFVPMHRKWRIYSRRSSAEATLLHLPAQSKSYEAGDLEVPEIVQRAEELSALQLIETVLHQSDIPPCAIINDAGNVVFIHGRTGRYLEPAEGKASVNIVEMARPGLKGDLTAAIRRVAADKKEAVYKGLTLDDSGSRFFLNLKVRPILEQIALRGLMMVVFEESAKQEKPNLKPVAQKRKSKGVNELEQKLQFTKESLRTTIEELETSNEELKSTNEELQSTNEELQSTNEELETSKEELQSLNEESTTVNAELRSRIEELSTANDDVKNLLDSTEIAAIFLDTELQVRRFTPKATKIVPLTAVDFGRPIEHLACTLADTDIAEYGQRVLADLAVREAEVRSEDDRVYVMRARPYRTLSNVIDGVVITFEDITELKRQQQAVRESEERYRLLFELASDSIVLIDPDSGRIVEFNRRACTHLGYTQEEFEKLEMRDIEEVKPPTEVNAHLGRMVDRGSDTFETRHKTKDGEIRDVLVKVKAVAIGEKKFLLSTWHDITPGERRSSIDQEGKEI